MEDFTYSAAALDYDPNKLKKNLITNLVIETK